MFSASQSPAPACQRRSTRQTQRWHSMPSSAVVSLPTGECQFILLHPSVADQRCSCQGFRRNERLPGAHCECGHQACYHSQHNATTTQPRVGDASLSQQALLDRIHSLEAQYHLEKKLWEEELKEERRARREDVRVLREAMWSFFQFMEQDVPRKFVDIEDKIESVVDSQQQLQERVITVDDSSMVLEDRVTGLEKAFLRGIPDYNGNRNGPDEYDDVSLDDVLLECEGVHDEAFIKGDESGCALNSSMTGVEDNVSRSPLPDKTLIADPDSTSTKETEHRGPGPTNGDNIENPGRGLDSNFQDLTPTFCGRPREDISILGPQLFNRSVPECGSCAQSLFGGQQLDSAPFEKGRPLQSLSLSPSPLSLRSDTARPPSCPAVDSGCIVPLKRKRYAKDEQSG